MEFRGAIDFRIQPPWRWRQDDAEPASSAGLSGYQAVYGAEYKKGVSLESLQSDMQRLGIRGVLHSEPVAGGTEDWNDRVAETLGKYPDLFLAGFCSADPRDIMQGVREIDRCYHDLKLRGLSLCPDFYNIDLSDKRCYPLIAKAAELGIPVGLHVGINFTGTSPIRHGHPSHVDEIACHFPKLILICLHGGWPWPTEMIAVAWKHPNIYLEFGAIAPRYLGSADSGWNPMRHFINSQLQDRILLGSDWPMIRHDRLFAELPLLDLKPAVLDKYIRRNAEALLDRILK